MAKDNSTQSRTTLINAAINQAFLLHQMLSGAANRSLADQDEMLRSAEEISKEISSDVVAIIRGAREPAPSAAPSGAVADSENLGQAVSTMDCFSQEGFSKISSIAKLTLAAMEAPASYLHPENMANALKTISSIADDVENCINCEAEAVGFNYIGADRPSRRRRSDAYHAAKNGGAQ